MEQMSTASFFHNNKIIIVGGQYAMVAFDTETKIAEEQIIQVQKDENVFYENEAFHTGSTEHKRAIR